MQKVCDELISISLKEKKMCYIILFLFWFQFCLTVQLFFNFREVQFYSPTPLSHGITNRWNWILQKKNKVYIYFHFFWDVDPTSEFFVVAFRSYLVSSPRPRYIYNLTSIFCWVSKEHDDEYKRYCWYKKIFFFNYTF